MKRKYEKGSSDSLSNDITRKFESLQRESNENEALKRSWIDGLQSIARNKFPNAKLVLTGSSANMFGFKQSDCDLTLLSGEPYIYSLGALASIEQLLPTSKYRKELVRGAKVPVLKLKDKKNFLEADINCGCERNIRHTYLLRCYALLDSRVRPLGLVIKLWAKNAGIINQRDHKLSGFTLLLLYIYYLQTGCSPPVVPLLQVDYPTLFSDGVSISTLVDQLRGKELPENLKSYESPNKQTLSELFIGFLRFYANFAWGTKVVSISRRHAYVSNNRPHMKIEDPYEVGGNCARGIYEITAFMQIRRAFTNALRQIENNLDLSSVL